MVPTIGGRPEYLPLALKSIRAAGDAYIVLVGNKGFDAAPLLSAGLIDKYLDEPTANLAAKINFGFRALPEEIEYINFLGDDDLLTPNSLATAVTRLDQPDAPVLVFGACEYIDPEGKKIFTNKSGQWAVGLLRFGPQLIPHPGSLYRRDAFELVGGLATEYQMAFDFDLFIKLSKQGKCAYLPETLAKFRWHPGSLSVSRRRESVKEASLVRRSHLPNWAKPISTIWEWPVRQLTLLAGLRVSKNYLASLTKT